MSQIFLSGLLLSELEKLCESWGVERYRARQILDAIYRGRALDVLSFKNLPKELIQRLSEKVKVQDLSLVEKAISQDDRSVKFLYRLPLVDKGKEEFVEAVWMPQRGFKTVCLSTQVGCPLKCSFCASGQVRFKRNLEVHEIVGQLLMIQASLPKIQKCEHVVFMGMGEPLLNLQNVLKSIEILNAPWGFGIGARKITISTAGYVPGILELAKASDISRQVRLSISLHATRDDVRSFMMPINEKYPVSVLMNAVRTYCEKTRRKVTFEYLLLKDLNDHREYAQELARLAQGVAHSINVIEYNEIEGAEFERSLESKAFMSEFKRFGVVATLRRSKGRDIAAACGQLRGAFLEKFSAKA